MKLILENFRVFGVRTELHFADTGVTLLSAPSGTGKTTVLDAIEFVLFNAPPGHAAAGHYENAKTKTTSVTLEHSNMRIKRTRRPNTVSCTFLDTGTHLQENECEEVLRRIFGFRLTDPLRDVISKMSGCEDYEVYVKGVRDYGRVQRAELQRLGGELEGVEKMHNQLPKVEKPTRVNRSARPGAVDVRIASQTAKRVEDVLRSTRDGMSLMRFKRCALDQELRTVIQTKEAEENHMAALTSGITRHDAAALSRDLTQLEIKHNELSAERQKLSTALENAWVNIANLCEQNDAASQQRTAARERLRELGVRPDSPHRSDDADDDSEYDDSEVTRIEKQIETLRDDVRDAEQQLVRCDEYLAKVPVDCLKSVAWSSVNDHNTGKLSSYEDAAREYEDSASGLRGRWQYVKASLHGAATHLNVCLQNYRRAGGASTSCDRDAVRRLVEAGLKKNAFECADEIRLQMMHDAEAVSVVQLRTSTVFKTIDVLKRVADGEVVRDNLAGELDEAYVRVDKLEAEFKSINAALADDRERIDTLQMLRDSFARLAERDAAYRRLAASYHALRQLPDAKLMRSVHQSRSQLCSADATIRGNASRLKAYLCKRDELYVQLANLQMSHLHVETKHGRVLSSLALEEEVRNAEACIQDARLRQDELSARVKQLDAELVSAEASVAEQTATYEKAVAAMETATVVANAIRDWDLNDMAMTSYANYVAHRKNIRDEMARLQFRMQSITLNLQGVTALLSLINDSKLTSIRQTVNTVNTLMATMLGDMFQDGYVSAYVTECATAKDGKMVLAVTVNGNECRLESLSTGEAARVNLALKVALFRVSAKRAPLCLDECFSNLDADSAKCSMDVVKSVLNTTKQPMIVTVHQCDDGMFDHVVRL